MSKETCRVIRQKKIMILFILWCIIVISACYLGYKSWCQAIPPGIDSIEIKCNWNGSDTWIASCLNEIILQEDWSSVELICGENEIRLPINNKVTIESMLWRLHPQSEETKIQIHAVRLLCEQDSILEYVDDDLISLFESNNYSNMTIDISDNEVQLLIGTEGDSAYCRFSQREIDKIKNAVDAYQKENLAAKRQNVIVRCLQYTIVILVMTFWLIFFSDQLAGIFFGTKRIVQKNAMHYEWIYMIRGMAIIAVVVCHQLHFLHDTEYLQMFSMYSVTTFIFCMGVTKWLSLKKAHEADQVFSYWKYVWKSLKSALCSYLLATICYLFVAGNFTYWNVLTSLVNFNASGPLYFMQYVIVFSLLAPILYDMLNKLKENEMKTLLFFMFCVSALVLGYTIEPLGSTYLFVYVIGMVFSSNGFLKMNIIRRMGGLAIWGFSVFVIYDYYFNAGEYWGGGVNRLVNKVTGNPPNFSVLFYSLGSILLFYSIFTSRFIMGSVVGAIMKKILVPLGKYSLDIFMWHLMIQRFFVIHPIYNIWLRRIVVYGCMFSIPIIFRKIWIILKQYLNTESIFEK